MAQWVHDHRHDTGAGTVLGALVAGARRDWPDTAWDRVRELLTEGVTTGAVCPELAGSSEVPQDLRRAAVGYLQLDSRVRYVLDHRSDVAEDAALVLSGAAVVIDTEVALWSLSLLGAVRPAVAAAVADAGVAGLDELCVLSVMPAGVRDLLGAGRLDEALGRWRDRWPEDDHARRAVLLTASPDLDPTVVDELVACGYRDPWRHRRDMDRWGRDEGLPAGLEEAGTGQLCALDAAKGVPDGTSSRAGLLATVPLAVAGWDRLPGSPALVAATLEALAGRPVSLASRDMVRRHRRPDPVPGWVTDVVSACGVDGAAWRLAVELLGQGMAGGDVASLVTAALR